MGGRGRGGVVGRTTKALCSPARRSEHRAPRANSSTSVQWTPWRVGSCTRIQLLFVATTRPNWNSWTGLSGRPFAFRTAPTCSCTRLFECSYVAEYSFSAASEWIEFSKVFDFSHLNSVSDAYSFLIPTPKSSVFPCFLYARNFFTSSIVLRNPHFFPPLS